MLKKPTGLLPSAHIHVTSEHLSNQHANGAHNNDMLSVEDVWHISAETDEPHITTTGYFIISNKYSAKASSFDTFLATNANEFPASPFLIHHRAKQGERQYLVWIFLRHFLQSFMIQQHILVVGYYQVDIA